MQPTRIGLSATQRPIEDIARFLVGASAADDPEPNCVIVDVGHQRELDLALEVPPGELAAVCSHECWGEVYQRLTELIASQSQHVDLRQYAPPGRTRLTSFDRAVGEDAVAGHHGSMSRSMRFSAEERLKTGQLKAIGATASLEMGIDVGYPRPGLPDRLATVDRHLSATRGAIRAFARPGSEGTPVSALAR